jgi:peptidoglycan hydrolase FlgJ
MIQPVAPSSITAPQKQELRKAAEGFEEIFLRQIIGEMRKAKLADDLFGSSATDSFRELTDANSAKALSARGAFGIADMVERQFAGKGAHHD